MLNSNTVLRVKRQIAFVQNERSLDMFNTNTRESTCIEIDYPEAIDFLMKFDGKKSIGSILSPQYNIVKEEAYELLMFLKKKKILICVDQNYPDNLLKKEYRRLSFLEDYCESTSEVIEKNKLLSEKTVLIVGLGAVGTWVADSLVRAGVKKFILMDNDLVEISNLHRQSMYIESDVGKYKVDCVKKSLLNVSDVECLSWKATLDKGSLEELYESPDLIINCADYPSVDYTTKIVGEFCMPRNIPHLIGGGYNLHLSLIGQTVLPGKTACVKCFDKTLSEINDADLIGVKKLNRADRKIGSFGPLSSLSASLTSLEAIKVIIGETSSLNQTNKRLEFRLKEMDFFIKEIPKRSDCDWCGEQGKYSF